MASTQFGLKLQNTKWTPDRDLIGRIDVSPAGNICMLIGREVDGTDPDAGWAALALVAMTPSECRVLIRTLITLSQDLP